MAEARRGVGSPQPLRGISAMWCRYLKDPAGGTLALDRREASPFVAVGTAGLKDALRQFTQPQSVGSVLISEERRKMHWCSTKP